MFLPRIPTMIFLFFFASCYRSISVHHRIINSCLRVYQLFDFQVRPQAHNSIHSLPSAVTLILVVVTLYSFCSNGYGINISYLLYVCFCCCHSWASLFNSCSQYFYLAGGECSHSSPYLSQHISWPYWRRSKHVSHCSNTGTYLYIVLRGKCFNKFCLFAWNITRTLFSNIQSWLLFITAWVGLCIFWTTGGLSHQIIIMEYDFFGMKFSSWPTQKTFDWLPITLPPAPLWLRWHMPSIIVLSKHGQGNSIR